MEWKRKADSENGSQIMNSAENGCQVLKLVLWLLLRCYRCQTFGFVQGLMYS